jgi:hypothetical protein
MTEYEIADLAVSTQAIFWEQMQAAGSLIDRINQYIQYFTALLFGYLIAVYFIGAQLTRIQLAILNVLYLLWQARIIVLIRATEINGKFILDEMRKVSPDFNLEIPSLLPTFAILALCIIASLYFMWSIRHPKEE